MASYPVGQRFSHVCVGSDCVKVAFFENGHVCKSDRLEISLHI